MFRKRIILLLAVSMVLTCLLHLAYSSPLGSILQNSSSYSDDTRVDNQDGTSAVDACGVCITDPVAKGYTAYGNGTVCANKNELMWQQGDNGIGIAWGNGKPVCA